MICVLGRSGQLASALSEVWPESELARHSVRFVGREELDFESPAALGTFITALRPELVINAVAYTAVDLAETERERAFKVNAESVGALADVCAVLGIPMIHISSDYVYDGSGEMARSEDAAVAPLGVYGASKAAGDEAILKSKAKALIFRTSWVYHHGGKNFVRTMLKLGAEREELAVVADQVGAPSSAEALARAVLQAAALALKPGFSAWGVYHMAGRGETSWHGFAEEIFREARRQGFPLKVKKVRAISSKEYPTPAKRPHNSRLDQRKLRDVLGIELPAWQDSLAQVLRKLKTRQAGEKASAPAISKGASQ